MFSLYIVNTVALLPTSWLITLLYAQRLLKQEN